MREQRKTQAPEGSDEELPFAVELWDEAGAKVQKILARASRLSLARAIYKAAIEENQERRITIRHDGKLVAESTGAVP
ncbi:MAG TPA: hypothetical protein VN723_05615 [Rhizomicrobium sp.]|nr:hypothetical protein [Rhizomicrobium sp.]